MLTLFAIVAFALGAMVTSSLAYTVRAWRYALAATLLCALPAIDGIAEALHALVRYFSGEVSRGLMVAVAAIPFGLVLANLGLRRRRTPRHTPGPEDDPLYRRFRAEKIRRRRLERQREEELENRDESADPV